MFFTLVFVACIAGAWVFLQSLYQIYTPGHMTGRVFSVSTLIGNTSLPIAYAVFGILLNLSSITILMAVCGACLIILCLSFSVKKRDKDYQID
jgi:hypothetical protein